MTEKSAAITNSEIDTYINTGNIPELEKISLNKDIASKVDINLILKKVSESSKTCGNLEFIKTLIKHGARAPIAYYNLYKASNFDTLNKLLESYSTNDIFNDFYATIMQINQMNVDTDKDKINVVLKMIDYSLTHIDSKFKNDKKDVNRMKILRGIYEETSYFIMETTTLNKIEQSEQKYYEKLKNKGDNVVSS